jgi:hypothetical protein
MLPSLYTSGEGVRAWSPARAAAYGAGIGVLAALLKIFGLRHDSAGTAQVLELAAVALAFALLCAGAAALRNFLARRVISPHGSDARR